MQYFLVLAVATSNPLLQRISSARKDRLVLRLVILNLRHGPLGLSVGQRQLNRSVRYQPRSNTIADNGNH